MDAALDTPENQPGRCFHTYFLVSDGVLRWHEHPEWDQSLYPACTDATYQENYQYASPATPLPAGTAASSTFGTTATAQWRA